MESKFIFVFSSMVNKRLSNISSYNSMYFTIQNIQPLQCSEYIQIYDALSHAEIQIGIWVYIRKLKEVTALRIY